jgi:hypothetical protein
MAGRSEKGNVASGSMKSWNFLYSRKNYWLTQKYFVFLESVKKGKVIPLQARLWPRGWVEV